MHKSSYPSEKSFFPLEPKKLKKEIISQFILVCLPPLIAYIVCKPKYLNIIKYLYEKISDIPEYQDDVKEALYHGASGACYLANYHQDSSANNFKEVMKFLNGKHGINPEYFVCRVKDKRFRKACEELGLKKTSKFQYIGFDKLRSEAHKLPELRSFYLTEIVDGFLQTKPKSLKYIQSIFTPEAGKCWGKDGSLHPLIMDYEQEDYLYYLGRLLILIDIAYYTEGMERVTLEHINAFDTALSKSIIPANNFISLICRGIECSLIVNDFNSLSKWVEEINKIRASSLDAGSRVSFANGLIHSSNYYWMIDEEMRGFTQIIKALKIAPEFVMKNVQKWIVNIYNRPDIFIENTRWLKSFIKSWPLNERLQDKIFEWFIQGYNMIKADEYKMLEANKIAKTDPKKLVETYETAKSDSQYLLEIYKIAVKNLQEEISKTDQNIKYIANLAEAVQIASIMTEIEFYLINFRNDEAVDLLSEFQDSQQNFAFTHKSTLIAQNLYKLSYVPEIAPKVELILDKLGYDSSLESFNFRMTFTCLDLSNLSVSTSEKIKYLKKALKYLDTANKTYSTNINWCSIKTNALFAIKANTNVIIEAIKSDLPEYKYSRYIDLIETHQIYSLYSGYSKAVIEAVKRQKAMLEEQEREAKKLDLSKVDCSQQAEANDSTIEIPKLALRSIIELEESIIEDKIGDIVEYPEVSDEDLTDLETTDYNQLASRVHYECQKIKRSCKHQAQFGIKKSKKLFWKLPDAKGNYIIYRLDLDDIFPVSGKPGFFAMISSKLLQDLDPFIQDKLINILEEKGLARSGKGYSGIKVIITENGATYVLKDLTKDLRLIAKYAYINENGYTLLLFNLKTNHKGVERFIETNYTQEAYCPSLSEEELSEEKLSDMLRENFATQVSSACRQSVELSWKKYEDFNSDDSDPYLDYSDPATCFSYVKAIGEDTLEERV